MFFSRNKQHMEGFTIAELIVVTITIGIIATMVIALYPGYQMRNRDSKRQSDVSQLAAALSAYAIQKNSYITTGSGCGWSGTGNGWLNAGPNAQYPRSISACLQDANVLASGSFSDPSGCVSDTGGNCGTASVSPVKAYMKATCQKGGVPISYIMAYLETAPRIDSTVDALCDSGTVAGFDMNQQKWGSLYGMNYYVVAK